MNHPEMVEIFSLREYNASQMSSILRNLELLVTSRYYAGVLSLEAKVPQIAVGHDTRLGGFYKELESDDYLIDYMSPKMWEELGQKVDELLGNPNLQREKLNNGFKEHFGRAIENPKILKNFIKEKGWNVR